MIERLRRTFHFTRRIGSRRAGGRCHGFVCGRESFRNLCCNIRQRRDRRCQRRDRGSAVVLVPLDEHRDAATPPEQDWGIEADDLLRLYQAAVDGLPEKTRRVFLMHRIDELSYRAIHESLGISVATVEYHMMKALTHIAREVGVSR